MFRGENVYNILVVDDEVGIAKNIKDYLSNSGYNVTIANDGEIALEIFKTEKIDLIILDLMLPKITGEEVCAKVRQSSNIPIIMLTAKVTEENKITGLETGADSYLTKPFSLRELLAVVNSLFRRVNNFSENGFVSFNNNDLKVNYEELIVQKNSKECVLTKTEREILFTLSKFPKKVFTRNELIEIVLGDDFEGYDRAIDSHIKNLRSKIEDNTAEPKYILTVRGIGYKFGEFI